MRRIVLISDMQRRRSVLTKVALPMDFGLTAGPLANVDIEGKRVPPKAISTSFGGCLKIGQKAYNVGKKWKRKSSRVILGKKVSALELRTPALLLQLCRGPHLINENLEDKWIPRPLLRSDILGMGGFFPLSWLFVFKSFRSGEGGGGGVRKGPGTFCR